MVHGTIHIGRGTIGFPRHMDRAAGHMDFFAIHTDRFPIHTDLFRDPHRFGFGIESSGFPFKWARSQSIRPGIGSVLRFL